MMSTLHQSVNTHLIPTTTLIVADDGSIGFTGGRGYTPDLRIFPPIALDDMEGALWMAEMLQAAATALMAFHLPDYQDREPAEAVEKMLQRETTLVTQGLNARSEPCTHEDCPSWGCQK